jgi:hypothetical protein
MPRRPLAVAAAVLGVLGLGGCAQDTSGRFCDVLKRLEASADPLDDRVLQDPAALRAALTDVVATYDELARVAPESMRADARTLSDAYHRIQDLFARANDVSASVNGSAAFKELTGPAFQSSVAAAARYGVRNCGIKLVGRSTP